MPIRVHTCTWLWFKPGHACRRVTDALDEMGIQYEAAKGPLSRRARRYLKDLSGQRLYPVVEFEDGSTYRDESKEMAATIRAGKLDEKRGKSSKRR